ncbi:hypothetical protein [Vibrio sp. 1978]|uniref:lipopolysaccharide biosynthesis protein n=1 Tax=Vibrio sp. 1978 TaxID=3074585 RepID=UPI002966F105|nr:hypothetical protein [Vibrio sp. 1978]MDW3056442.1 hypothetical protein [Vibrio sp. 1978]
MKIKSDISIGKILHNGSFVAVRFLIYTISGFVFVPFLISEFGSSEYGLIALAGFLTQYIGMISDCIGSAVSRYLNLALNRGDSFESNEIYNTALMSNCLIVLINIPIFYYCLVNLDFFFEFNPVKEHDFLILVTCNVLVFFIALLTGVFKTAIQASNRIDISAKIDITKILIRLIVIFLGIKTIGAYLWIIGVVDLVLAMATFVIYVSISKKLAPQLKVDRSYVSKKWIKPVLNMSSWSLVAVLGFSLITQTDTWILNRFVDAGVAGVFAALLVWPNFVKQITKQIESVIAPVLLIDYARGNEVRFTEMLSHSSRFLSSLGGIITGGLLVVSPLIINYWLPESEERYILLLQVMIFYLAYTLPESILWRYFLITNQMSLNGIISITAGILNILLSVAFIKLGYGFLGVALATSISLIVKDAILVPFIIARKTTIKYSKFVVDTIISSIMIGISFLMFNYIFNNHYDNISMLILLLLLAGLFLSSLIIIFNKRIFNVLIKKIT